MTTTSTPTATIALATADQLAHLRLHAVNDVTRAIMRDGILLSHDQADELREEVVGWLGGRLGLNTRSTDRGVECTPPVDYVGVDEDGNRITADEAR